MNGSTLAFIVACLGFVVFAAVLLVGLAPILDHIAHAASVLPR